ncbi:MAG: type II secretion system protein [Planctomycetota bacterium]
MRTNVAYHRPGVTLIEVLVSLTVIAVLIAILVPSISIARKQAQKTVSLSNLRGIGQITSIYTESYRSHPFGLGGWGRPPGTGNAFLIGFGVWRADRYWPVFYHDIAPWQEHAQNWISPGAEDGDRYERLWQPDAPIATNAVWASYRYSNSFVGDPGIWSDGFDAETHVPRATRPEELASPARKAMFYNAEPPGFDEASPRRGVLAADSAARSRKDSDAADPRQNPLRSEPPAIYHDTVLGVRGSDF